MNKTAYAQTRDLEPLCTCIRESYHNLEPALMSIVPCESPSEHTFSTYG